MALFRMPYNRVFCKGQIINLFYDTYVKWVQLIYLDRVFMRRVFLSPTLMSRPHALHGLEVLPIIICSSVKALWASRFLSFLSERGVENILITMFLQVSLALKDLVYDLLLLIFFLLSVRLVWINFILWLFLFLCIAKCISLIILNKMWSYLFS